MRIFARKHFRKHDPMAERTSVVTNSRPFCGKCGKPGAMSCMTCSAAYRAWVEKNTSIGGGNEGRNDSDS